MESSTRLRRGRALVRVMLTVFAAFQAAMLIPAAAEASIYVWVTDGDGRWDDAQNWRYEPNSGPFRAGYPNAPGDQAAFVGTYTRNITVTLPDERITVGGIVFSGVFGFTIQAGGHGNNRLVFDNGSLHGTIFRVAPGVLCNDFLNVHLDITGDFDVNVGAGAREFFGRISGLGHHVTKQGAGEMFLMGAVRYSGGTTIDGGQLTLADTSGERLPGGYTIGEAATLIVAAPDVINDINGVVTVNRGGRLEVLADQALGRLIVSGTVRVRGGAVLTMLELNMSEAVLESETGGRFVLRRQILEVSVDGSGGSIIRRTSGDGKLELFPEHGARGATFLVAGRLDIALPVGGVGSLVKERAGTLRFSGTGDSTYTDVTTVLEGRLELACNGIAIPRALQIGGTTTPATVSLEHDETIYDSATVRVNPNGTLLVHAQRETIGVLEVFEHAGGAVIGEANVGAGSVTAQVVLLIGGHVRLVNGSRLGTISLSAGSTSTASAVIDGSGSVFIEPPDARMSASGPKAIDLRVDVPIAGADTTQLSFFGPGTALFTGNNVYRGATRIFGGTLLVTGAQRSPIILETALDATEVPTVGGTGTLGALTMGTGIVAPGVGPGRLTSGSVAFAPATTMAIELNGTTEGTTYDQLDVHGTVSLGSAKLTVTVDFTPPAPSTFTILRNDDDDPVTGTFAGLAEGATLAVGGRDYTISYRGGDGNDVVLSILAPTPPGPDPDPTPTPDPDPPPDPGPTPDPDKPVTYYLAEGATGSFFDDDVLIANPNTTDAPVTLTFLQEGGATVVEHRTVAAQSRVTVHVDQIAGLEETSASVQVTSDNRLPLVVERTMFWDGSYYGGHTSNAVPRPEKHWIFAEGFQGFFDTYVLIANANATATTATITFLREHDTPVVKAFPIAGFARKTIFAGDIPELVDRGFGMIVDATLPVIAERSMYFASLPGHLWSGGHANTGITTPATSWFHAEGATGAFFTTYILLANPQDTAAHVDLRFLLDTGEVITRTKTLAARQRLTVNPAAEGDTRLENAAVSTIVQSDVPIVSERSMYWPGDATPFGEGHNSSGVVSTRTRWGLAEGRLGGEHAFDTFILLANPSTQQADVTVTYLRERGAPIVKTYTVPPTSRFNIDVKAVVPELKESSFGARIDVTNNVPIAVERSMYWDANGIFWAGGSNALATPLP